MAIHPIRFLRIMGILDGLSLITLLFIAMPLKYFANLPIFVTINGSLHGGIFVLYIIAIAIVQIRIQWNIFWSISAIAVAFIPFGNFIYELKLKKMQPQSHVKPIPKQWLVYAIIFFSFFDLFVQLPVMSTYALSVGATTFIAGIVVGMYSFMNTFGNIFSGVFTDKIGAFKILIFGLCASVLSLLAYQIVDDTTTLLIVRCIHGFSSGFITPAAFTLLANTTANSKQGSGSAITGSFVGIAAIVGPATGGILASKISVPNVLSFVALYGFLSLIGLLLFLRNTPLTKKSSSQIKDKLQWNNGLMKAYGGAFFLMFSQGVLAYLLPMYVEELGYSSRMSGTLMSVFGIVAVLIFLLPTNRIFDYINSSYTLLIGVTVLGISQIIIGQSTTTLTLYAALALYGMGFAFFFPAINTILIESTTKETRGKAYGYFYAFFSMGVVAGSFILGTLNLIGTSGFWFTGLVLFSFSAVIITSTIRSKQDLFSWRKKVNE
ncbi:multidrug transporter [Solibacillus sp. R5-41]|uniref:MFS transporter n=1 Tax=Solibacillus sp. R5-41 TaxID=2048654 RepID=UPI000C126439|nr:MFS transporter [Solibacillus sp. R5-41]ATP39966.1 multidrug transporter [Solibacillus sp. R5-41]